MTRTTFSASSHLGRLAGEPRVLSGAVFLAIGLFGAAYALRYRIGTTTQMGPGYFPLGISLGLCILGLWSIAAGAVAGRGAARIEWHIAPVAFVALGTVAFGVLIETHGVLAAVPALTAIVCYRRWRRHPLEAISLAVGLSMLTAAIFVYALGMPFVLLK